jgi:hypothetical protein
MPCEGHAAIRPQVGFDHQFMSTAWEPGRFQELDQFRRHPQRSGAVFAHAAGVRGGKSTNTNQRGDG